MAKKTRKERIIVYDGKTILQESFTISKMSWKELTKGDCREWKLSNSNPHDS